MLKINSSSTEQKTFISQQLKGAERHKALFILLYEAMSCLSRDEMVVFAAGVQVNRGESQYSPRENNLLQWIIHHTSGLKERMILDTIKEQIDKAGLAIIHYTTLSDRLNTIE